MLNPESRTGPLTPRMMYSYDRGLNKSWGLPDYRTPRIYQDARMEAQKRAWAGQKKGERDKKHVTKRGFYMDYSLKVAKSIPGSNVYQSQQPWDMKKELERSKSVKVDQKLTKNSYLDQIEREQKNRKKPGVGAYSLEKSLLEKQQSIKKIKSVISKTERKRYFYEDIQNLSNSVPGVGNYNTSRSTMQLITPTKLDKTTYQYWVDKHKKQSSRDHQRSLSIPTAGTYTPLMQSFATFEQTLVSPRKPLKNGFGSDSRFPYVRQPKAVIKELRPGPTTYETGMKWHGKDYSQKRKQWHEALWKGSLTQSVYRD